MKSKIKNQKSKMRSFLIAALLQLLFAATAPGQKYENGTRLLKGAEVMSATPLQLDYVLENLADTAKITVNLHEGKTHLILNDGSGAWREWWYHQGRWKVKSRDVPPETDPTVAEHVKNITASGIANWNTAYDWGNHATQGYLKTATVPGGSEGSIQTRAGKNFAGSTLGIHDGYFESLSSSDVGFTNDNATFCITPQGEAEHRKDENLFYFRSSPSDTTFYLRNRIRFYHPNTNHQLSINTNEYGNMSLVSKRSNTISQISLFNGGLNKKGIDLFSSIAGGSSQISVTDEEGITLNSRSTFKNRQNEIKLTPASTNFTWKDADKSREFSLNDATMEFMTKQGSDITSRFYVYSASLTYYSKKAYFNVDGNSMIYRPYDSDKNRGYFAYSLDSKSLRVRNTIYLETDDNGAPPSIALTADGDIMFRREALPSKSITLTEICQKGQIIEQETEPAIPDNSFAFWVNGSTFYLILRSNGIQKKIQFD